jgi:hypothetical protein
MVEAGTTRAIKVNNLHREAGHSPEAAAALTALLLVSDYSGGTAGFEGGSGLDTERLIDTGDFRPTLTLPEQGGRLLIAGAGPLGGAEGVSVGRQFLKSKLLRGGGVRPLLGAGPGPSVGANKSAGDAVRDAIAVREAPSLIEETFMTVGGARRVDVLKLGDTLTGIESKVGRTALTPRVRQELARDWWLRRQGQLDAVTWEFSPSSVTGEVGPTPQLLEKLDKLKFDVRVNK